MASENQNQALSPGHLLNEERVLRIPPSHVIDKSAEKINIYNRTVRIATWNVRSLYMIGKLRNVQEEMSRMNIDLLGMSEVRWPGSGQQSSEHGHIYFSGGVDVNHRYGVAVLVSSKVAKSVIDFVPLDDRVMVLKLQTSHRILNIIQIYAPTNDKPEEDVESFYNNLDRALKTTKKGEITIVMGDYNAKVGQGDEGDTVGKYGLGERNARGDRLVQFCTENNLYISNTFYKLHPRRLYTWKSPADGSDRIVRNQIDFILVDQRYKKFVKSVKTYPGSDINSDHNPIVMTMKMQRFIKTVKPKINGKIEIRKLKELETRQQVQTNIENKMKQIEEMDETDVETGWNNIKDVITDSQKNDIGYTKNNKKQEWMTPEILELMNIRRQFKKNEIKYRELNKIIRRKCREAREKWLSEKCSEIEALQEKHDSYNVHKKVKEFTGKSRKRNAAILKNTNNEIIIGVEDKIKRWEEYIKTLFEDDRPNEGVNLEDLEETGPNITKSEVIHAIKMQKSGKATGPDEIHAETLKIIAEQEGTGLNLLIKLFNSIYSSGKIPSDWLKSTFVTLPKKSNASHCDDYRMISLMSHALKVFLRIIHTRIYRKCESQVDDMQFGFRNGVGTREALFSLNVLTQRCRDMNVDVYACFIDYSKAFDRVKHQKLLEILKTTGIDKKDLRIISELYWNQTAEVRVDQMTSETISIKKGVRQGCILSPLLFNIYSEKIFREALDDEIGGIKINGYNINNIRYADDTVVIAGSIDELQHMINRITEYSEVFGLSLNVSKTKLMVFSKRERVEVLRIGGSDVGQVSSFKYLGTSINDRCDIKKEIRSRIEQARKTFINMKNFFTRTDINLELKMRMIRCYVFSVLLYGCESWTLDPGMERRMDAFEMYLYRRILKIPWTHRVTNIEVLRRVNKEKELLHTVKRRKILYLGHVMRGEKYERLRLIIEGKVQGKRSVGRRQNSWLRDLRRWIGCTSADIFRSAVSRIQIAIWIANLH